MLEESRDVLLCRRQQHAMPRLDELGKRIQVAKICLTSERTQPFLHAQIGLVILQEWQISLNIHTPDYLRVASGADREKLPNHVHQGIKCGNNMKLDFPGIVHRHDTGISLYGWARSVLILFSNAGRSASPLRRAETSPLRSMRNVMGRPRTPPYRVPSFASPMMMG